MSRGQKKTFEDGTQESFYRTPKIRKKTDRKSVNKSLITTLDPFNPLFY